LLNTPHPTDTKPGILYVVATPIGNLADFSPRAIEVLNEVDLVLAEDTRKYKRLASHFNLLKPVLSYYEHNEKQRTPQMVEKLKQGTKLALVSEAGTPAISDPGYQLIRCAHEANIPVRTIPGPCSAAAALSISGLPTCPFMFHGFLPHKEARKRSVLSAALKSEITTVFFESPHRILKTLRILAELSPQSSVFLGRELTKVHEENVHGTAGELHKNFSARSSIKGEFVLIVKG
jgi:16S rRNA (cytidine1402-2'-O)-methyltransferase